MENIINVYKEELRKEQKELNDIVEMISSFEENKIEFEKNIEALKQLITSKNKEDKQIISNSILPYEVKKEESINGSLVGMQAKEAYKKVSKIYFEDKIIDEQSLRAKATKEGLRVNGKEIASSYSRAIITQFIEEQFFDKVDRGKYKIHVEENNGEEPTRRLLKRREQISQP